MDSESLTQLVNYSVLAQEHYTVLHCKDAEPDDNYIKDVPMNGTWIIVNILGQRDVTLVW